MEFHRGDRKSGGKVRLDFLEGTEAERSELSEHGAPGESGTEAGEADVEGLVCELFIEVKDDVSGDSGTAGIAKFFDDVVRHPAGVDFHFCGEFFEHEAIGLVEDVVVDGWFGAVCLQQEIVDHGRNGALDKVEDCSAIHDELVSAAKVLIFGWEFDGSLIGGGFAEATSGDGQCRSVCSIHFEVGINGGCIGVFFDDGDTDAITNEREAAAVSGADFAADDIAGDEQHFTNGGLFEQQEGLDEADEPCGAALGYIHTEQVLFELQASLDDVCGRRHEVIRGLRKHQEGIEFIGAKQFLVDKELDAVDGEVGDAGAFIDDAMFVVPHDLSESSGAFWRKAAGGHVVHEVEGAFGQNDVDSGDFFARESEVHCGAPLRWMSAWMFSRLVKFSGMKSRPSMAILKVFSSSEVSMTISKESRSPSSTKLPEFA
ncbi:MAG: hypothetical protein RLZZ458_2788 [Planctomycetota bacterium]